ARAGADIEDRRTVHALCQAQTLGHEPFAVGAGDEDRGADFEIEQEEFLAANQVLDRAALGPLLYQLAVARQGFLRRLLLDARPQLDALPSKGVGQEQVSIEPGLLDALLRQE